MSYLQQLKSLYDECSPIVENSLASYTDNQSKEINEIKAKWVDLKVNFEKLFKLSEEGILREQNGLVKLFNIQASLGLVKSHAQPENLTSFSAAVSSLYFSLKSVVPFTPSVAGAGTAVIRPKMAINPEVLRKSFECLISSNGHDSLDGLKAGILAHFKVWDDPETLHYAPIASLSQGSGSGKSNLAVEMVKDGPGFYIVFRADESTGYPKKNELSAHLKSLLNSSTPDPAVDLTSEPYSSSIVGRVLMFFAKVITGFREEWAGRIRNFAELYPNTPIGISVRRACTEMGSMFERNDGFDCSAFLNRSLEDEIVASIKEIYGQDPVTVDNVASYIGNILTPCESELFNRVDSLDIDLYKAMQDCLDSFPFIFILDEADELDDTKIPGALSKRQILRRALSYLHPETKLFFLTLGTKSDVYDLNPPMIENSLRSFSRPKTFEPIILLSNTSIFSKNELPLENLILDQKTLTNPVMFKYLSAQGHPIWSSLPFDQMIRLAEDKLLNGSADSFKYVLVIWMIRAGLFASPTDLNTRTLIASHMATLFDLTPDLMKMVVFYPSEPILAITCRKLIKKHLFDVAIVSKLFDILRDFLEAVDFDQGNLIEVIGSMLVLLTIDQAESSVRPCTSMDQLRPLINELSTKMPDFKWLWEKKKFILEPADEPETQACRKFPDYHVVTVESFLSQLLGAEKFASIKSQLPEATLKGIVNASHAVKVVRTGDETLKFENTTFEPMKLPLADDRITDKNCNLIDESMLKLGLAQQCMFLMPANYFAYDLVVPLILEDSSVSFLGIQFKANGRNISNVISGMQTRFHYVKCPKAGTAGHLCAKCAPSRCASFAEPDHSCPSCTEFNRLAALYSNQISLYLSLNSANSSDFSPSTVTFLEPSLSSSSRKFSQEEQILQSCLTKPVAEVEAALNRINSKSGSFLKPLVETRRRIGDSPKLLLVSSLWRDANVSLKTPVEPDPFLHRQLCIATRGLEVFAHLFLPISGDDEERLSKARGVVTSANNLINDSFHFFQRLRKIAGSKMRLLGMLKSILYDGRINYLDFNYELARMRGLSVTKMVTPAVRLDLLASEPLPAPKFSSTEGYLQLLKEAEQYYKSIAGQTDTDWTNCFSQSLPSKNPAVFHRQHTRSSAFQWLFFTEEFELRTAAAATTSSKKRKAALEAAIASTDAMMSEASSSKRVKLSESNEKDLIDE